MAEPVFFQVSNMLSSRVLQSRLQMDDKLTVLSRFLCTQDEKYRGAQNATKISWEDADDTIPVERYKVSSLVVACSLCLGPGSLVPV